MDVFDEIALHKDSLTPAEQAVSRIVLKEHLETCVVERVQAGDTEVVDEVMDLLKKFGA